MFELKQIRFCSNLLWLSKNTKQRSMPNGQMRLINVGSLFASEIFFLATAFRLSMHFLKEIQLFWSKLRCNTFRSQNIHYNLLICSLWNIQVSTFSATILRPLLNLLYRMLVFLVSQIVQKVFCYILNYTFEALHFKQTLRWTKFSIVKCAEVTKL